MSAESLRKISALLSKQKGSQFADNLRIAHLWGQTVYLLVLRDFNVI
jgi:hypothetical protein